MIETSAYRYRAVRSDEVMEVGVLDASSRDAALRLLAKRGLFPLEVEAQSTPAWNRQRLSAVDWGVGLRILGDLLEEALPLEKALSAFEESAPRAWVGIAPQIRVRLREGMGFPKALESVAAPVPAAVQGLVRAGAASGDLAGSLKRAAQLMEQIAAHRTAVASALAYPAMLAFAGALAAGFLAFAVLPRFADLLTDFGGQLPTSTRLVLAAADTARQLIVPAGIAVVIAIAIARSVAVAPAVTRRWHGLLLTLPAVGRLRLSMATVRVSTTLAALLDSGVPVARALALAGGAAGDRVIESRLMEAREAVVRGSRLSHALASTGALAPTAVRFVAAGEDTGRLASMLARAARLEQEWSERRLKTVVRLLEPMLILLFGGFVALAAASLLQAVYGIRPG